MASLICSNTKIRVSSVLNRDVKQFGKQNLTDNNEETCWNSDQGSPQFIAIDFPSCVIPSELLLRFQGGFVGRTCTLLSAVEKPDVVNGSDSKSNILWDELMTFHPQDVNSVQTFSIQNRRTVQRLKIVFDSSTDFYGRITIYSLDILGSRTDDK